MTLALLVGCGVHARCGERFQNDFHRAFLTHTDKISSSDSIDWLSLSDERQKVFVHLILQRRDHGVRCPGIHLKGRVWNELG
jgi:hypothetical protein